MGALLDRASVGLLVVDGLHAIAHTNETAKGWLGGGELVGLAWEDLVSSAHSPSGARQWLDSGGEALCWQALARHLRAVLIASDGDEHWVAIHDETDHVQMSQEAELLRLAVNRLEALALAEHAAGALAHDLNNILQAVVGLAELATERFDDAGIESLVDATRQAAKLSRLLLETGRPQRDAPLLCDPRAVVLELEPILRSLLGPRLRLELEGRGWIALPAPALVRVILNLAANARDATSKNGVVLLRIAREGDELRIEVCDTGVGMSGEVLGRARELTFTTKKNGTGLGLALVHRIVKRHGGRLVIDSQTGRGTAAAVIFPISSAPAGAMAQETESGETNITTE